ncbi:hypothetical protein BDD12DRAFT_529501 [Trichophaea hybrida]|nr:hypothetical protein BDD12DRAFT_529501 [Trichophaea hybrida]
MLHASRRRELPNVRGRQKVHHRLVTYLHGKQLRYLYLPTPARFPARCLPHLLPELLLLVFPAAAVTEEMLPRLGRRPSAPPALVVLPVSEPFEVKSTVVLSSRFSLSSFTTWSRRVLMSDASSFRICSKVQSFTPIPLTVLSISSRTSANLVLVVQAFSIESIFVSNLPSEVDSVPSSMPIEVSNSSRMARIVSP